MLYTPGHSYSLDRKQLVADAIILASQISVAFEDKLSSLLGARRQSAREFIRVAVQNSKMSLLVPSVPHKKESTYFTIPDLYVRTGVISWPSCPTSFPTSMVATSRASTSHTFRSPRALPGHALEIKTPASEPASSSQSMEDRMRTSVRSRIRGWWGRAIRRRPRS